MSRDDDKGATEGVADAPTSSASRSLAVARVRDNLARVVWIVCMALALVLAAAAFTYALEANADNSLVKLVRDLADVFDLGFFDLDNPVKAFEGKNAVVKTALFNYGLASVVYLVIGRVLERVIRP
ncbi:hypothetical protein [Nocardioides nitrophenolicus]|uniref:hypothetical protein n=1 Tax=Nocardioides nitrophenolicus TaxID=60489 RepID=UPI0027DBA6CE|nr:hypothetical protein [Nocardioides nitrophenolicus]MBM7519671.1 hypothetical protein [Nocardioides nitrophenolicus]